MQHCGEIILESIGDKLPPSFRETIRRQFNSISIAQLHTFYEHIRWCQSVDLAREINFAAIGADTLLINGELDPICDAGAIAELQTLIPRCFSRVLPNVNHFLHNERKEIMWLYRDFLLVDSIESKTLKFEEEGNYQLTCEA